MNLYEITTYKHRGRWSPLFCDTTAGRHPRRAGRTGRQHRQNGSKREQTRAPTSGCSGPGRTQPITPDPKNARRSLGVLSRAPSAMAHCRRRAAVPEDRWEGHVPTQGHRGLRGSQSGPEGVLKGTRRSPERIGNCSNDLESIRMNLGGANRFLIFGTGSVSQSYSSFEQNIVRSCAGGTQIKTEGVGVRWGPI